MKHIVIVTGGYINLSFADQYLKTLSYDKVFAVDKGLEYVSRLGLVPDYIVGDFDSVESGLIAEYERKIQNGEVQTILERYPAKKDATDTELALLKAKEEQAGQVTILGGTGSRLDHVLANMGLLIGMEQAGIACFLVDETNRIRVLVAGEREQTCVIQKKEQFGNYVSIVSLTPVTEHVTLEGMLYPLAGKPIYQGSSLTISNEISDCQATITIQNGRVLIIESRD